MINTDLHIHSCVSPCADREMTPEAIVARAREAGLELIAVCDHNTVRSCDAAADAARAAGIGFIPGIEVTTSEDIHCIVLLPDTAKAHAFSRWLDTLRLRMPRRPAPMTRRLPIPRDPEAEERELLYMARRISIVDLPGAVAPFGGLVWPAHADKNANSVYSVLGCWTPDLRMDAVELCADTEPEDLPEGLPRLRGSNAHRIWDIRSPGCPLPLSSPDFAGLRAYLKGGV